MRLHLFKYTCKKCGLIYKAPELSFDSYGEYLMRSPLGEVVYLNALSDSVYAEVNQLLRKLPSQKKLSSIQHANLLWNVFGIACDSDSRRNRYGIKLKPVCEACGNQEPSYWEATEPPEIVDIDIPEVTHRDWSGLTEQEKLQLLGKVVGK